MKRKFPPTIQTRGHRKLVALLVAARDRADLRQTEVAERLGRSQTWVSRIEAGERRIDVVELYLLARLFELDPRELLRQIWPPE